MDMARRDVVGWETPLIRLRFIYWRLEVSGPGILSGVIC